MFWRGILRAHDECRRSNLLLVKGKMEMEEIETSAFVRGPSQINFSTDDEEKQICPFGNSHIHDDIAIVSLLKACVRQKDLQKGSRLYCYVLKEGLLKRNIFVGNTLIHMFGKCGALEKAQEVFDEVPVRDAVSWTALVSAFAEHGHSEEAINYYEQMQHEGLSPDSITLASVLKACGSIKTVEKGEVIHTQIVRKGHLEKNDVILGNALVDMYAKCGALEKAQQVFDTLPFHDVVSWNALITGYYQYGQAQHAINCYEQMTENGFTPDSVTFTCVLEACASIGELQKGEEIHVEVVRQNLSLNGTDLANALVDMYSKCGALQKALHLFNKLSTHDVFLWSSLLAGYCQYGHGQEALDLFKRMKREGPPPDEAVYGCILQACSVQGAVDIGEQSHAEIVKKGFVEQNTALGSALVDMYIMCGMISRAQQVFNEIQIRNVVLWNALINGYCQLGHCTEALKCLDSMQGESLCPDEVTLACILKACGSAGADKKGEEIHIEILRKGLLEDSAVLGNALVDMYAKCGALVKAQEVFYEIPVRNLVTWNALLTGYSQHGFDKVALIHYECLEQDGFYPNEITFACILKACGTVGAAWRGREIHAEIARKQLFGDSLMLGNALVDMYGKCGELNEAQQVFAELSIRDVVSWNALMGGYCNQGCDNQAIACFEQMTNDGICPDVVTFMNILKVFGNVGATGKGQSYFDMMSSRFGIVPSLEHQTCMLDLFSRAGHMDKALAVLEKMPSCDYFPAWCSLLGACKKSANLDLAELAFEHATRLEEKSAVAYVFLSSIYLTMSTQEGHDEMRASIVKNKVWHKHLQITTNVACVALSGEDSQVCHCEDAQGFRH